MNDTEELLLDGMARFTADVDAPSPGLAVKAGQRRRRRRIARAATGTLGTFATAAGIITVVAMAGPGPAPAVPSGQQAQTAAYVLGRTESALAAVSSQDLIQYVRETATGKLAYQVSDLNAGIYSYWAYRGQARFVSYGAGGQPGRDTGVQTAGLRYTTTQVNYQARTWSRRTIRLPAPVNLQPDCGQPSNSLLCALPSSVTGPALGTDWVTGIRAALRYGGYRIAGTQQVDGVRALKLEPVGFPAWQGPKTVFWVDPSTYLPVRDLTTVAGVNASMRLDFQWLRPTQQNLADVDVTIPAGFTQVPGH